MLEYTYRQLEWNILVTFSAVFARAELSTIRPKYSAVIEIIVDRNDGYGPYVSSDITSAAVFDSVIEAKAGAARAIRKYDADGMFPNMCEVF